MILLHPNWKADYRSVVILLMEDDDGKPIYAGLRHVALPEEASKTLANFYAALDIANFSAKPRKWVILRVDPYDPDTDPARSDT
jgi:hypothetical protein